MKHKGKNLATTILKTFVLVILCSHLSYSQIGNPGSLTFQPITIGIHAGSANPNNNAAPIQPPNGMTADQVTRQNNENTMSNLGYKAPQGAPTDPYLRDQYIKQSAQQAQQRKQQAYLEEIYRILNEDLPSLQTLADEQRLRETKNYQDVFQEIQNMQNGISEFSLKRAVFLIENAWLDNTLDYSKYTAQIEKKVSIIKLIASQNNIEPTNSLGYNYIIQKLFSESTLESKALTHLPFRYDFEDYMGEADWSKMFVTKLIDTGKGQCHSLPLLYLILAEQTNTKAWLSYAPEHSFIMFSDDTKKAFYNFETTNGNIVSFDWIMQSGYVNTSSIRNRIYMDTLSRNQLISTLVADLVMGYTNKFGYDEFVGSMVDYILVLNPRSIQGLIFKADIQVMKTEQALKKAGNPPIKEINLYPDAYSNYTELLRQYDYIDALGYSRMPKDFMKNGWPQLTHKKHSLMPNRIYTYFGILLICLCVFSCRTHKTIPIDQPKNVVGESLNSENNSVPSKDTVIQIEDENRYKAVSQPKIDLVKSQYEEAYEELEKMLSDHSKLDFKRAVFLTEDAYFDGSLDYPTFTQQIKNYSEACSKFTQSNIIKDYPYSDSMNLKKNFVVYSVMTGNYSIKRLNIQGFQYDFEGNSGDAEWSTTFVSRLLKEGKGTCHSLPYLYKIIANEIGAEAYLSLAPNHLYLKHRSKQLGWYNTELTSGQFPTDAWVKASGYITIDAIRSGIYMDTLGQQQSVALCAYDLAMGYSKKTGNTLDGFILNCCDLTLKYHPQNINAIILKAETLKKNYEFYLQENDTENANRSFSIMKSLYVQGVQLGYREMPKEMYAAWLQSSIEGKEEYTNSSISSTLNSTTK